MALKNTKEINSLYNELKNTKISIVSKNTNFFIFIIKLSDQLIIMFILDQIKLFLSSPSNSPDNSVQHSSAPLHCFWTPQQLTWKRWNMKKCTSDLTIFQLGHLTKVYEDDFDGSNFRLGCFILIFMLHSYSWFWYGKNS